MNFSSDVLIEKKHIPLNTNEQYVEYDKRICPDVLSIYEFSRLISLTIKLLEKSTKIHVDASEMNMSTADIAFKRVIEKRVPFKIERRYMVSGNKTRIEIWKLNELDLYRTLY